MTNKYLSLGTFQLNCQIGGKSKLKSFIPLVTFKLKKGHFNDSLRFLSRAKVVGIAKYPKKTFSTHD